MKIQIIIGTTRIDRFSETAARYIYGEAKKRKELEVELLDLRDYPMPFYEDSIPPKMLKGKYTNAIVKKWAGKISKGDGYIIVTGEYNHGYPAVLKNALDYIYYEWGNKPVGFVAYGSVGGSRAIEQLRQVVAELQMTSIRSAIYIPWPIYMAAREKKENPFAPLASLTKEFLDQLTWWTKVLKSARDVQ
ncbi:NAD(P)H-dependent oxidoreductase [Patescibacteria group bacterium]|nr:NAD(P)H-dependent oxidoreductase [Patescibacteria group bacterium]